MADKDKSRTDATDESAGTKSRTKAQVDRRRFLGTVTAGASAAAVVTTLGVGSKPAEAEVLFPKGRGVFGGGGSEGGGVYRSENDLYRLRGRG